MKRLLITIAILGVSGSAIGGDSGSTDSDHFGFSSEELLQLKEEVGELYKYSPEELLEMQRGITEQMVVAMNTREELSVVGEKYQRLIKAYDSHPDNPFSLYVECPVPDVDAFKISGARKLTIEQLETGDDVALPDNLVKHIKDASESGEWIKIKTRSRSGDDGIETWMVNGEVWLKTASKMAVKQWGIKPGDLAYSFQLTCEYPRLLDRLK